VHGACAELVAQHPGDGLLDARLRAELVALHADVVLPRIQDAPLHERVDQERPVALREEAQRLGVVEGEDAHVEEAHVLQQRPLEVQARAVHDFLHLAELEHDRVLALVDGEERARGEQRHHGEDRDDRTERFHRSLRSRFLSVSRERGPASAGGSAGAARGAAEDSGAPAPCMIFSSGR
jgi:hypothetical protein